MVARSVACCGPKGQHRRELYTHTPTFFFLLKSEAGRLGACCPASNSNQRWRRRRTRRTLNGEEEEKSFLGRYPIDMQYTHTHTWKNDSPAPTERWTC